MAKNANSENGNPGLEARLPALLLCAASAAALLSYSVLTAAPFSIPKFAYSSVFAVLAFAALLYGAAFKRRPIAASSLDAPVAASLAAVALSAVFSVDRPLSVIGHYEFYAYGLAACVVYCLLYGSASRLGGAGLRRWVSRTLVLAGAVAGVVSIIQAAGLEPFPGVSTAQAFGGRVISVYGNPVYAGSVFSMLLPLCLYEIDESRGWKPLFIAAALVLAAGLFLTKARGAWLAGAAGAAFYAWGSGRLKSWGLEGRRAALAVSAFVGLVIVGVIVGVSGKSPSDRARLALWRATPAVFFSRPILGVGPAAFGGEFRRLRGTEFIDVLGARASQQSAHNDLLQILCTTGIAGLGVYLWLLTCLFFLLRRALQGSDPRAAAGFGAALLALFLQAKVNPTPYAATATAAVLLGLLVSVEREGVVGAFPGRGAFGSALFLFAMGLTVCVGSLKLLQADRFSLRARVYRGVGRVEWAESNYRLAIAANPFETEYRMEYLKFLFNQAAHIPTAEKRRERLETAAAVARDSVRLRPAHVDSHQMLGLALIKLGDLGDAALYAKAIEATETALGLDPHFPMLLRMRGALAEKTGEDAVRAAMLKRLEAVSR